MMKVAIPDWQGRVSPVFDVAGRLLVADVDDGGVQGRSCVELAGEGLHGRVRRMAGLGVDVLICGAISRPLESALTGAGVDVVPRICGDVETVLEAFAGGRLDRGAFSMPGCCGRQGRGRRRGRRCAT